MRHGITMGEQSRAAAGQSQGQPVRERERCRARDIEGIPLAED